MPLKPGKLWIVATPLGNLEDFSPRGARALEEADLVLAEDTRRAASLCKKCGITAKGFESFFEHNEAEKEAEIIARLLAGDNMALITDAGTPLLSDPGYRLVRSCRENHIEVSAVPGPSAPVTALSIAGIAPVPFTFLGFLPRTGSDIRALFEKFRQMPGSLVFFERKNRLKKSLEIASGILNDRETAICRELTKIHEEVIFISLADFADIPDTLQGELTVIIGPPAKNVRLSEKEVRKLLAASDDAMKPRDIAREAARQAPGWNSSEIYRLMQND